LQHGWQQTILMPGAGQSEKMLVRQASDKRFLTLLARKSQIDNIFKRDEH
jgi:hypothetical protein